MFYCVNYFCQNKMSCELARWTQNGMKVINSRDLSWIPMCGPVVNTSFVLYCTIGQFRYF